MKPAYRNERVYFFIFWLLYAYLAIFYLRERCTYADNSYYLFNIIQHKSLNLEHYRYAGFFSQWLAVIAVKFKLSCHLVLFCFTISPVLYHFGLFVLVYLISNNRFYVYMYLTLLVGAVYYSYFFTSDELSQNMPVFMVLVAIIKSEKITMKLKCILVLLCQVILLFTHPLIIAVAGMLVFVLLVQERNAVSFLALMGIIVLLLVKFMLLTTGRDQGLMHEISYKGITLRNIHSSAFAIYFRRTVIERHLPAIILWGILFVTGKSSVRSRVVVVVTIIVLYMLIMLFLLHIVNKVYIDRYMCLLLVYAFAAMLVISKPEKTSVTLNIVMTVMVTFSFYRLFTMDYLDNRNMLLDEMLSKKEIKQIYRYEDMPECIQQMSWSVPYETLLISTLNHEAKTVLIKESFYRIDHLLADSTLFLGAEWTFGNANTLDKDYFKLPPAVYQYK